MNDDEKMPLDRPKMKYQNSAPIILPSATEEIWSEIVQMSLSEPNNVGIIMKLVNLFLFETKTFPKPFKIGPNQSNSGLSNLKFVKKRGIGRPKVKK